MRAVYEADVAAAREALGDEAFTTAWSEGAALSAEAALTEALALANQLQESRAAQAVHPDAMPALAPATGYPDGLSTREVEVLRLIAAGKSTREIATALTIAEGTVERHVTNLYGKIGARNRAEATSYAHAHALIALRHTGLGGLSSRELEVLRLIAVGKSNREIAARLVISENTVFQHVRSILNKTGCANRTEAAVYAHTHGLVE
jgi:DNA-binding NarL/FixJ family response regulator